MTHGLSNAPMATGAAVLADNEPAVSKQEIEYGEPTTEPEAIPGLPVAEFDPATDVPTGPETLINPDGSGYQL